MDYDIEFIGQVVKKHMCEKRYNHTLGVQKEAIRLGEIFLPDKIAKLSLAGLLHDITKDYKQEKQIELCNEFKIAIDKNNIVPKLLHSKTGCVYAKKIFGEKIVDGEVYNGIYYHTTGRENMTLFEALIYLADYIEEGRTFGDCIYLREYFYSSIEKAVTQKEKFEVLRKTMVLSFDLTIKNLIDENKPIDKDTISARNYFLSAENLYVNVEE